jgi:WD40 repeat protein
MHGSQQTEEYLCIKHVFFVICALFLVAGGGANASGPTQPSITATATVAAVPTMKIAEKPVSEVKLETQTGTAYTLDWSFDGKTLAVGSGFEISLLSNDLTETIAVMKPEGGALGVTWSPDKKQFATVNGFRNPTISLWDWDGPNNQLTLNKEIRAGSDQYGVAWSPNGKMLATLGNDRQTVIQIWDTNTWKEIQKFELEFDNPRRALNWSTDSTTLYDAWEINGQIVMFGLNISNGLTEDLAKTPMGGADVFAISPDATKIAIADSQGKVRIFDPASPKLFVEFQSVSQPVDMVWNPSGTTLAILDYKTTLQLWNVVQ